MNQFIQIRFEALVTRREGMIAENKQRELEGKSLAYTEDAFRSLSDEMILLSMQL